MRVQGEGHGLGAGLWARDRDRVGVRAAPRAGMAVLCPRAHTIASGVKPVPSDTFTLGQGEGQGRC